MSTAPILRPNSKAEELQRIAQEYNRRLMAEFPTENFAAGGDVFLGKYYCHSGRIYLGLNPGGDYYTDFKTDLLKDNLWDMANSKERFFDNCGFFVREASGLHDWITPATVAFCSPWRTRNGSELHRLNGRTAGKLFQYSGALVRILIEDHKTAFPEAKVTLIVAGRASLYLLCSPSFLKRDWRNYQTFHNGATGTYQWAKVEWNDILLYQVPHFARANSRRLLAECAKWLADDLGL